MKKNDPESPAIKGRTITLSRHASIDEHIKLQERLITEMENLEDLEEEKKQSAKSYKDQIEAKEGLIKVLRQDLKGHKITLTQECNIIKDYSRGEWIFVDTVTGEEVFCEKFTNTDWQINIEEEVHYTIVGQPKQLGGKSQMLLPESHIEDVEHEDIEDQQAA